MEEKDLIKQKIDIVDLINEYIPLKKAGNSYKACCPFHNEKTPSFNVSQEKQMFHCFGCAVGGDIFTFVEKMENVEFFDAFKLLAEKAGVELKQNKKFEKTYDKKSKLFEINKEAESFFYNVLIHPNYGKKGYKYLIDRGITKETIEEFKLGFAPDSWDSLIKALKSKGYNEDLMLEAGLIIKNDKGKRYDRFRNRIMIPIHDISGKTVGFTSRILPEGDDGKVGKYINTPQTLIYNKSEVLFGLDKAKRKIREDDYAIVVEGNMDVIMSHQADVKGVVASSGTALTVEQVQLIKRITNNIYICFDQDEAGRNAAMRGIDIALSQGMNIFIVLLPEKFKDPADLIVEQQSLWVKAVENKIPMMDYFIKEVLNEYDINTGDGKKNAVQKIMIQINKLTDLVEKDFWIKKVSRILDVPIELLKTSNKKIVQVNPASRVVVQNNKSKQELLSESLYSILLKFNNNINYVEGEIELDIISNSIRELVKKLFLYYNDNESFNFQEFSKYLQSDEKLLNIHNEIALLADKEFSDYDDDNIKVEIIKIISSLKSNYQKNLISKLQSELYNAEQANDQDKIKAIMEQIALQNSSTD